MEADGTVAIATDPLGGIFGIYHRTDAPDAVKEGTSLISAADVLSFGLSPADSVD